MTYNPLHSLTAYSQWVTELLARSTVVRSTVTVWSVSPYTGIAEGEVFFTHEFWLRLRLFHTPVKVTLATLVGRDSLSMQNQLH